MIFDWHCGYTIKTNSDIMSNNRNTGEDLSSPAKYRKDFHMEQFLMKPKVDFAFKEIMTDEKARTGFLAAVLKINPEDIKETQILNTNLRREHEDDKQGILDVRLLMNNDAEIDIEIHLSQLKVWAERSLFYLSKMYTEQISPGQSYNVFKKCINISILDFELFPDETEFYSCFHIREDTRNFIYTDKMEFHLIELPKLPAELREDSSDVELWAKFINSERKEDFDMLAQKNQYIESAYERLQLISQDREKRLEYEAREKAILDHNQMMLEAEERGREQGWEQGEKNMKERINKLNMFLIKEQRFDDLERAASDDYFQQQLMEQFGI